MQGVKLHKYHLGAAASGAHPFARRFDLERRRAEQVLYSLSSLRWIGLRSRRHRGASRMGRDAAPPHLLPGRPPTRLLRVLLPRRGSGHGLRSRVPERRPRRQRLASPKNAATLLALSDCDRGFAPTAWQRSTFPAELRGRIDVVHEGVDGETLKPDPKAQVRAPVRRGRDARRSGGHIRFAPARAAARLSYVHAGAATHPQGEPAGQVIIIGDDGPGYGLKPPNGKTWRTYSLDESPRASIRRACILSAVCPISDISRRCRCPRPMSPDLSLRAVVVAARGHARRLAW